MTLEETILLTSLSLGSIYLAAISLEEINRLLIYETNSDINVAIFINIFILGLSSLGYFTLILKKCR